MVRARSWSMLVLGLELRLGLWLVLVLWLLVGLASG